MITCVVKQSLKPTCHLICFGISFLSIAEYVQFNKKFKRCFHRFCSNLETRSGFSRELVTSSVRGIKHYGVVEKKRPQQCIMQNKYIYSIQSHWNSKGNTSHTPSVSETATAFLFLQNHVNKYTIQIEHMGPLNHKTKQFFNLALYGREKR